MCICVEDAGASNNGTVEMCYHQDLSVLVARST
jgi:hypothetical protein